MKQTKSSIIKQQVEALRDFALDKNRGFTEVEEFLTQSITTALEQMAKSVKIKKKSVHERDWNQANLDDGYNQAKADSDKLINDFLL